MVVAAMQPQEDFATFTRFKLVSSVSSATTKLFYNEYRFP